MWTFEVLIKRLIFCDSFVNLAVGLWIDTILFEYKQHQWRFYNYVENWKCCNVHVMNDNASIVNEFDMSFDNMWKICLFVKWKQFAIKIFCVDVVEVMQFNVWVFEVYFH